MFFRSLAEDSVDILAAYHSGHKAVVIKSKKEPNCAEFTGERMMTCGEIADDYLNGTEGFPMPSADHDSNKHAVL